MPMTKRDAEKLSREHNARFVRHGDRHDIWENDAGEPFQIPRHSGDLSPGVERKIKEALGLK